MKVEDVIERLEQLKKEEGNLKVVSHPANGTDPRVKKQPDGTKIILMSSY